MFRIKIDNASSAKVREKILVAGNHPGALHTLAMVLGKDYEVICVSLQGTAINGALTEDIQMVLIDVGSEDIAGNEMLQVLKAINNRQRVVILSRSDSPEGKSFAFGKPFKHLVKPFHYRDLRNALAEGMVVFRQQLNA